MKSLSQYMPLRWQQFNALTKPRVIQLIVFCALIGMVLAVPGVPNLADVKLAAIARRGRAGRGQWPAGVLRAQL